MSAIDHHAPGTPCWVDLLTPDVAAARTFYGAVLGWSFEGGPAEADGYTTCMRGDAPVAGIVKRPETAVLPTGWTMYLRVEDLDASVAAVRAAGGGVAISARHIVDQGRMAVVTEPGGATFGLWQPEAHLGAGLVEEPGAMTWHEVNSRTAERTRTFLAEVFGYEVVPVEGMAYWTLNRGDKAHLGVLEMTEAWEGIPPHVMNYFAVADADTTSAAITTHSGRVMHGPFDTPFGRMAVCADPAGAIFSIIASTGTR